jgi:hypothetical protein
MAGRWLLLHGIEVLALKVPLLGMASRSPTGIMTATMVCLLSKSIHNPSRQPEAVGFARTEILA